METFSQILLIITIVTVVVGFVAGMFIIKDLFTQHDKEPHEK